MLYKRWALFIFTCSSQLLLNAEVATENLDRASIEKKISELQFNLHKEEMEKEREEVNAQEYMIADWQKYSEEIQKIKKKEDHINQQVNQLHELERLKAKQEEK